MSNKKSYMSNSNLIAEGFFSKLFKKVKDKKLFKKLKKDKELNSHIDTMNKTTQSLEDDLNDALRAAGEKPIKLDKFSIRDFI